MSEASNRYGQILTEVFDSKFSDGDTLVEFARTDLEIAAGKLGIEVPKNLGDLLYSFRFRNPLPLRISGRAPDGCEWVIRGVGRALYAFVAVPHQVKIVPNENLITTKIPDATPEIIRSSALGDEQALLALVRYNRLIDIFMGVAAFSLQNHLRTTVPKIGQVEVDEVYVAVDRFGVEYIIPVQAKGGSDTIGITQIEQDLEVCAEKFENLVPRPVAVQFMAGGKIAMFELGVQDDQVVVVREAHYTLVAYGDKTSEDRALYLRALDGSL